MRKFFIVFFILLALGGAGFFFGWVQLEVSPGSYGIMRSKTHGIDETLIREGEFRWVWYKLIPANTDIRAYRLPRVERRINQRGVLPSADVYASFAVVDADFSYEFDAVLSFTLDPDSLIPLVRERDIQGQDELDAYAASLGQDIEGFVLRCMESVDGDELQRIMETGASAALEREVLVNFPYIRDFSCRIPQIRFPDFQLYSRLRDLYTDYLDRQRDYMSAAAYGNAERHIDSRFRLDELAAYGDLLTRYPVLLEYLKLEPK
ncbi:MAG: hypothetical protein LBI94_06700 [Treponema sp.]|jgi:hypothetical protein|nr:hypothetical protein [Treponema sp.]